MWKSYTAIMYENMKIYATIVWLPTFYVYGDSCVSPASVFKSPGVLIWQVPTEDPQMTPKISNLFFFEWKEYLFSYSVSHLKTKQEIRSWKELSAPPKKNSLLTVYCFLWRKKPWACRLQRGHGELLEGAMKQNWLSG